MRILRLRTVVEGRSMVDGSLRHEQQQMADGSADVWSNTRGSLSSHCSAVSYLTACSQTLRPGKLTGWTGAGQQTRATRTLYLRVVSIQVRPYPSMESIKPAVYKMNSRRPRTNPRGTPNRTIFCVDQAKPRRTHSTLLVS